LGGKPVMSKVGHVNMKANLRETDAVFGGELSGHFYFRNNAYADSGAITLAVALTVLAQGSASLYDQIAPFRKYPQSGEINFVAEDKAGIMQGLRDEYGPAADSVLELDGVTLDCFKSKGWWFNVRASNTEPLLRLNAEAKDDATLKALLDELTPKLGEVDHGH
ncbi:MAG: phosphomannomutase/phosphoglucomutase, partial [Planctomycetota bacterium]